MKQLKEDDIIVYVTPEMSYYCRVISATDRPKLQGVTFGVIHIDDIEEKK